MDEGLAHTAATAQGGAKDGRPGDESGEATGGDIGAWHLAATPDAARLAGLEFAIEHVAQAYYRWKSECLAAVSGEEVSGDDTAILNIVRMKDEAKKISEIARLLNRTDTTNIQYALRKLARRGLLEKVDAGQRREARYRVTDKGRAVTQAYARLREEVLLPLVAAIDNRPDGFDQAGHLMTLLSSLYGQAATMATARRY